MVIERRAITVQGVVQGVGFRPFVYRTARRLALSGFIRNCVGSVLIEAEGEKSSLDRFLSELQTMAPPLARIDNVSCQSRPALRTQDFTIEPSDVDSAGKIALAPDTATCPACLAELFDPANRRYRYPFLNCTDCGPRLTIVEGAPYDRQQTTMASFTMCSSCRAEYDDPADRRFHAQPTACADCGPRIAVHRADGQRIETGDPLAVLVRAILSGKIGAVKGLGGYHLVCDARDERAVGELRRRKHRDEKPLAIMVRDVETADRFCHINPQERELLVSPRRPIVLLRRRADRASELAAAVAPGNPYLGLMLPYTPLHHLLLHDAGDVPLVMTSGNRSDEPIAYRDADALQRLCDIADVFLTHDRPIHVRCDDSVTRVVAGVELPVRRSRGYAPVPISLPLACPNSCLAVGGQFKNVFAIGQGQQALLSHHLGDLDCFDAYRAFERDIGLYEELFHSKPERIVHDLHPDYASTLYAQRRAAAEHLPLVAVQHHHAHMASCMADNGLNEPVIGVVFDGTGLGTDGTVWGGEFLLGDYARFTRVAHLRKVRMPGADKAIAEPWRMAVSQLVDAGLDDTKPLVGVSDVEARAVRQMIRRGFNSPRTSSAGRLFDAVAALAGVRRRVRHEGQAAMEMEWLATAASDDGSYPFAVHRVAQQKMAARQNRAAHQDSVAHQDNGQSPAPSWPAGWLPPRELDVIDTRPLVCAVAQDVQQKMGADTIARRFHNTLVELITVTCGRIRTESGIETVVLSGGVFQNALLTGEVRKRLTEDGYRVYAHRAVPTNDGGISLGQLAVAAAVGSREAKEQESTIQLVGA